jgi:CheY-like chemotaxis protein
MKEVRSICGGDTRVGATAWRCTYCGNGMRIKGYDKKRLYHPKLVRAHDTMDIDRKRSVDSAAKARRPVIVIVDDNGDLRAYLKWCLEKKGYRVRAAPTGRAALATCSQETALVLLDLHLPDMDGAEVARVLRARKVRAPIVWMTARSEVPRAVRSLGDGLLVKPFSLTEALSVVRSVSSSTGQARTAG